MRPRTILILGSGALKIGEAGEFDYSGSQAIKALRAEGHKVILLNPNIATNQTNQNLANKIYFLPVTPEFVEKIIQKEKPDSILLSCGGQTALNCGVECDRRGFFQKFKIEVLGTPISTIRATEDRELFVQKLNAIQVKTAKAKAVKTIPAGLKAAQKIGYPVIVRAAYALGGRGSGFAANALELTKLLKIAFANSPQVLIEEDLRGWKEIEYEIVRDSDDNCIAVCNMENFDPLGIHTGESLVVAPSQTLNNYEYQELRTIALKTIRHLGIIGECNIQYALNPKPENPRVLDYRVIEVNARLSRSSALASKATGYPLAAVAAKIALGKKLNEIQNPVTQTTTACFEPALDYLVLKVPRWDLQKFHHASTRLGSEMKSVGEVMAIGRSFEEVLQKSLRMLQIGAYGFSHANFQFENLTKTIREPTPERIFALARALRDGWSPEKINRISGGIDLWFLEKLKNIVDFEQQVLKKELKNAKSLPKLSLTKLRQAKRLGFSDAQIAYRAKTSELAVRKLRNKLNLKPWVKKIDTFAAEFPAKTNYLYLTYHGTESDQLKLNSHPKEPKTILVLGSGAYCIGSSVEFDWCAISAVQTLAKQGYQTALLNYNPETVSTDYDMTDLLFFDELSVERVLDITEIIKSAGVVISVGGQVPQNLAPKLARAGVPILGTNPQNIDLAESREKFSRLCDELAIDQPAWAEFNAIQKAFSFAKKVGFPVLVRPSYVLSGAAMAVAEDSLQLKNYLARATKISLEAPVVISKFEENARELDFDGVAVKGKLIIFAISEHIENAGVHSGDATLVLPPQKTYLETIKRIKRIAKLLAAKLKITGPFNIQFLAKDNRIKVIEMNLRASRSFPFVSKVSGHNFIEIGVAGMLGIIQPKEWRRQNYQTLDLNHVGVKTAQFSFSRLQGADPTLGVEMASTGEVACFGNTLNEAFLKAWLAAGNKLPQQNIFLSIGPLVAKVSFLPSVQKLLKLGYKIFASTGTSKFLRENGLKITEVNLANSDKPNSIEQLIQKRLIDFVINIPQNRTTLELTRGYHLRRLATDFSISLLTNLQVARVLVDALSEFRGKELTIQEWSEYQN